jgi:hypothetical protein
MGIEMLKHVTEATNSTSVDGRGTDIAISFPQPKIFTSNAASPHEWFRELPTDIFLMTDDQRLTLHANVAAVFKRCFFLHVTQCMIPADLVAAFEAEQLAAFGANMAEFLGPPLP